MKPLKKQVFLAIILAFLTILSAWGWDDSFDPQGFQQGFEEFQQDFQGFVDVPAGFEPAIPYPGYGFNDSGVNYQDVPAPPPTLPIPPNAYPPSFPDSRLQEMEQHYQVPLPPRPPQYLPPQPPPQNAQSLGGTYEPHLNYSGAEQSQMIIDVKVNGQGQIPLDKIRQKVKSRPGRPFNELQVEEDKRALTQTGWFIDVKPNIYKTNDGIIITFDLIERALLHYVKFVGNKTYKKSKLLEEAMIAPGDALDPMAVNQAKTRIEDFYKQGGHHKIHVEILSGDRLTDRGAVFLISEGRKQRIDRVQFIGCNSAISGARLKTQVKSKPGILYMIGGEFTREQLDQDVEKLTEYYRNLGYFFAKVDRDFVEGRGYLGFGKEDCWVTVRFIIEEGPRCRVSRLNIVGNKVFSDKEILSVMKKIKVGDYYTQDGLDGDIKKIKEELYGRKGRVFTEVDYDFVVDAPNPKTGIVELTLAIRESRPAEFSHVTIDIYDANGGSDPYTKTHTVANRIQGVRPGVLIDTKTINDAERRLRYSQLFNSNPMQGYVPEVIFEVDEEKRRELFEDTPIMTGEFGVTRGQLQSPQTTSPTAPRLNFNSPSGQQIQTMLQDEVKNVDRLLDQPQQKQQKPQLQNQESPKGKRPTFTLNEEYDKGHNEGPILILGQGREVPSMPTASTNPGMSGGVSFGVGQQGLTSISGSTTDAYGNTQSGTQNLNQNNSVVPFEMPRENELYGSQNGSQYSVSPYPYGVTTNTVTSTGPFGTSTYDVNAPPAQVPSTYNSQVAYNQSSNRGFFEPEPFIPGRNNPSTQNGGIMDPVMTGSSRLSPHNNAFFNPKPEPIMAVPARVRVQETMTGKFQASVGVNSDSGLVANFLYQEDNFNWRRPPRNPFRLEDWRNAFRGAGERFKINASPGTRYQRYEAAWENPYFMNTDWSLGLSAFYYTRYYSEWRENRVGGTVSLGYRLTPDLALTTYYKGESVRIYDPITTNVDDLNRALGTNALHTFGLRLAHDTRDNQFLATEGHLLSFTAEQVVGSFQYPRLAADLRQYFMLHERPDSSGRWVLGFRSAASWTDIDTPIFERYYAGGFTTLRGFDFRGVSPRDGWMAIGGNFEFYNSAELLFPLTADDMIRGVVFVDTGCVQSRINEWDQKYRIAPGFGVRITIPFMGPAPIAFDFAFPVTKDPSDVTNIFSFYVGFMR